MNRFKNLLAKNIDGRKILFLFIVTTLVFLTIGMYSIPKVTQLSNHIKILDMMPFGYTYEYVNELFSAIGSEGRNSYLYCQIPIDMVYPFLFGITYTLVLAYFLKKINKFDSLLIYLCLLPLIAAFFDYLENFGTINLLNNYPNISDTEVKINSFFTLIKSMVTTIYFLSLTIIMILLGIKKIFTFND